MRQFTTGWTPEMYDYAMEDQDGICAIPECGNPIFAADHNHEEHRPRALLCNTCNVGVGWLEKPLTSAWEKYIKQHTMVGEFQ